MFLEKVKSEGLAHLSYVIGSAGEAAVVDPRRDCEVYVELAARYACRITHIFETHRNEDLVSGASQLAVLTGAHVYHGPDAAGTIEYASTTREGDSFEIGKLRIDVLQTPGHTDDSLSFAFCDPDFGDRPVGVFTGDALFVGDVGRTDFYPRRAREVAGLLYDSLRKLLDLGDQAVIYPAHGAGSVCGSGMADREISTLGYERRFNPRLQIEDRDAFIEAKLAEHHLVPPYFQRMEQLNMSGAPAPARMLAPPPRSAAEVKELAARAVIVDVRPASAFLGAHLPNSLALPVDMIASFAGWLLDWHDPLLLVADDAEMAAEATRQLMRIGYDEVRGYLAPALTAWAARGEAFNSLPVVGVDVVHRRLAAEEADWTLLDVRDAEEVSALRIEPSHHVYVGELARRVGELAKDRRYTVMCGSGARATVAASVLLRAGFRHVDLFLGSIGAWKQLGYPVQGEPVSPRA